MSVEQNPRLFHLKTYIVIFHESFTFCLQQQKVTKNAVDATSSLKNSSFR